ncbi:alpha/beta-hydrolase [Aspergillus taichungensis]|uniref:Alpha/beta-hydrolase n=1 Tax=Aspergillus taichungensis TaxID=482145 RepID=A0A2J5HH16_9EURO|nr:alpha/beta-hydrolase [Aspergillus taichungensis]
MFQFFKSPFFQFEFLRLLAMTPFEGGEIAEILDAASKIKDQDPESWYANWVEVGTKVEQIAQEAERTGDRIAARRAYLRASNYLRAAQFMLNEGPIGHDKRVLPTIERAIDDFRRGAKYLDGDVHFLDIPYENKITLPGYLYLPPADKRLPNGQKTPILINTGGGDSTQEEIYFINASTGPCLGYAVLTFDGPGQGVVLRRDKLPMRPDWEVVVGRVLDHLWEFSRAHPEYNLDLEHIGITGASMGGYYALRGALDPRIGACISVDGFYSMESFAQGRMPAWLWKLFSGGYLSDGVFDSVIGAISGWTFQTRWEFNHMRWAMGRASDAAVIRRMLDYTLAKPGGGDLLQQVKCPVLVTGAGSSFYFDPETTTRRVLRSLGHLPEHMKEEWVADDVVFGGLQAKIGAFGYSMQRTFAYLDGKFGVQREILGGKNVNGRVY